jgi:rRNA maturation RNase YbeY
MFLFSKITKSENKPTLKHRTFGMITIKNSQKTTAINLSALRRTVQTMLKKAGYPDFDLGIWLTTNATIRRYNKKYRGKDKATDILSFPFHADLKPGQKIKVSTEDDKNLGDIIISVAYAQKEAKPTWNRRFDEHLVALIAHGIAHLLGHDHETDKEWMAMQAVEHRLLQR